MKKIRPILEGIILCAVLYGGMYLVSLVGYLFD